MGIMVAGYGNLRMVMLCYQKQFKKTWENMGMLAVGYGDSLWGGILLLNVLKNERTCKLESNHYPLKLFQCLDIVNDSLNAWNKLYNEKLHILKIKFNYFLF